PPPILPLLLTCFWSCVRPPLHSFPTRRSSDLISQASFVACHQFPFIDRIDVLSAAEPGATFLLNAPFGQEEIWSHLPRQVQQTIDRKSTRLNSSHGSISYAVFCSKNKPAHATL